MYTFIYFTSLVFKLCQKQFSQNLQFCEGGTILKTLIVNLLKFHYIFFLLFSMNYKLWQLQLYALELKHDINIQ